MEIKQRAKGNPYRFYKKKDLINEAAKETNIVPEDIKYIMNTLE